METVTGPGVQNPGSGGLSVPLNTGALNSLICTTELLLSPHLISDRPCSLDHSLGLPVVHLTPA